jgi:hypothetical protein
MNRLSEATGETDPSGDVCHPVRVGQGAAA